MNNLEIAKRTALKTGKFLKKNFYQSQKLTLDDGRDIKLKIDEEAEEDKEELAERPRVPERKNEEEREEELAKVLRVPEVKIQDEDESAEITMSSSRVGTTVEPHGESECEYFELSP